MVLQRERGAEASNSREPSSPSPSSEQGSSSSTSAEARRHSSRHHRSGGLGLCIKGGAEYGTPVFISKIISRGPGALRSRATSRDGRLLNRL